MDNKRLKDYGYLVLFLAIVIAGGLHIGITNPPGEWYHQLQKPFFTPPNWVFAPAWTFLYILIAFAGWRTFMRDPRSPLMKLWLAQMALNWAWSPAWFSLHWMWGSVAIIAILWCAVLGFILMAKDQDRLSAFLFIPYLAWVSFAALLNISIVVLN